MRSQYTAETVKYCSLKWHHTNTQLVEKSMPVTRNLLSAAQAKAPETSKAWHQAWQLQVWRKREENHKTFPFDSPKLSLAYESSWRVYGESEDTKPGYQERETDDKMVISAV